MGCGCKKGNYFNVITRYVINQKYNAMKTILVPTDFSSTAKRAAQFALKLAAQLKAERVILYNAYQSPPILTEPTIPVMPVMDIDTMKNISTQGMSHFSDSIAADCPEGIKLEQRTEYGILSEDLTEVCKDLKVDLIVMGITGTSRVEEILIGSTATSVVKHTTLPVVVVPAMPPPVQ